MTILRFSWLWRVKPALEIPESPPDQVAWRNWCQNHTVSNLLHYLHLEQDASSCRKALERYMCRGVIEKIQEPGKNGPAVLEAFRYIEPQLGLLLEENSYAFELGFVRNVEVYHETRFRSRADELMLDRIEAIYTIFHHRLTEASIDTVVENLLNLLASLPTEEAHWLRDGRNLRLWHRTLEVIKPLLKHSELTRRELAQALRHISPVLAFKAQRELFPQK